MAPKMEIGVYSFGDTQRNEDGSLRSTGEAIQNLFEAITLADELGLDYFAIGEHHTETMPMSSPGTIIAAAAAATKQIKLSSGVSVISTDDPVRIYQQFSIADAIAGGGNRIEIIAGRGSSTETFPLFGYSLNDYDQLYADKLDLLLKLNENPDVNFSWEGTTRPTINDLPVVPKPVSGKLPIWLGTGGNPGSSMRAGQLGMPVSYGIIGGQPARFAPLTQLYRQAGKQAGFSEDQLKVSVATLGLVAPTNEEALERMLPGWINMNYEMQERRGWAEPDTRSYYAQAAMGGAYFLGNPDVVAKRIVDLYDHMGHMRHFLQMDIGSTPHEYILEAIRLLATEVKPRVDHLMAKK
ncbi:LLM class flavin-dependent oxidoreductase [Corynebacterium lubricantis]|uniref:LLM class flavin-dependent oxidoreductase n=1 Tax=Corynebacterium lubricantis TaxID=541095 RepID=UPI000361FDE1|nr:LLM class flavin-dependent oxidoreductase [Corynebacterium lubricantis]